MKIHHTFQHKSSRGDLHLDQMRTRTGLDNKPLEYLGSRPDIREFFTNTYVNVNHY